MPIFFIAVLVSVALACGAGRTPITGPSTVAETTSSSQGGQTQARIVDVTTAAMTLRVGEEVTVRRPEATRQWLATGADHLLEQLAPRGEDPVGPEGWRFRARAAGEGELTFTGHGNAACPDPPNCPPAAPPPTFRMQLTVLRE